MTPIGSILASTDFSMPSRHAADRAARLASEAGARLVLMHTVSRRSLDGLRHWLGAGHASEAKMLADAQQNLRQIAGELAAAHKVTADERLSTGTVIDEIGREADSVDADLIVLGARGSGFLRRMALGSTVERLLRRTTRPLLVVKRTPHSPYRRVMVALDFSPWSLLAVKTAQRVAPHARLVLLNAVELPFEGKLRFAGVDPATIDHYRNEARAEATSQLYALAHDAGLERSQWDACVVEGDAWMRIVEQEQALDCDLVVIGKHGQSAAEELLLGSVTSTVLAEGSRDVLVSTAVAG